MIKHRKFPNRVTTVGDENKVWELYHENSKLGRHQQALPDEEIRAFMEQLEASLPFKGFPKITLPITALPLECSLGEIITKRVSVRNIKKSALSLKEVATILFHAYGITRNNQNTNYPRPFRVVPSGGALYPLEVFFYSTSTTGLEAGVYHYNPTENHLRFLIPGDITNKVSECLVNAEIGSNASLIIFITAVFERSTYKYGDRGYRFILLEAGHVAQNINLVANSLGLGSVNLGGFFDREVDELLQIDGITQSTIYMVAIGKTTIKSEGIS